MYSKAERLRAIELNFKFGRKITFVIRELGYPTDRNLRRWGQAWEASSGDISCLPRKERYSDAQKQAAVDHYLTHGCSLAHTRRELGHPCGALLIRWIDELHPGWRRIHTSVQNASAPFKPEVKLQAVRELCTRTIPAQKIAQGVGVSRHVLYKWKDEAIGDKTYQSMRKNNEPSLIQEHDALREEFARRTQAVRRQQLELDILKKAEEIIKKDLGISVNPLTNREKTKVADTLRDTHPLPVCALACRRSFTPTTAVTATAACTQCPS